MRERDKSEGGYKKRIMKVTPKTSKIQAPGPGGIDAEYNNLPESKSSAPGSPYSPSFRNFTCLLIVFFCILQKNLVFNKKVGLGTRRILSATKFATH